MKLASVGSVKSRLSIGSTIGPDIIGSALDAATSIVENVIGSPLEYVDERVDWFTYNPSIYRGTFSGLKLYLTQIYVNGDVNIYYSEDGYPVSDGFSGLAALEPTNYTVWPQTGTILLNVEPIIGEYTVAVSYSAGFESESADIPIWLSEAAISTAISVYHAQTVTHNKKDIPNMYPTLYRILYSQLNEYIRPRSSGLIPTETRLAT